MITDLVSYLSTDAVLLALTGNEARIYPDVSKQNCGKPFLVYSINTDGTRDELLDTTLVNLSIYALTSLETLTIKARLDVLLDKQDQISIPSFNYFIYWCKRVGGPSVFELDTRLYHRAVLYALKFKKKS